MHRAIVGAVGPVGHGFPGLGTPKAPQRADFGQHLRTLGVLEDHIGKPKAALSRGLGSRLQPGPLLGLAAVGRRRSSVRTPVAAFSSSLRQAVPARRVLPSAPGTRVLVPDRPLELPAARGELPDVLAAPAANVLDQPEARHPRKEPGDMAPTRDPDA
jgi:hypothetical protein